MPDERSRRIALVGASGWVGRSLGPALLRDGVCAPADLVCLNRSGPSDAYAAWPDLRWVTQGTPGAAEAALADADVVILSIRPADFRAGTFACPRALVLSLMAGVPGAEVAAGTGAQRVVRAMPNAAVGIGRCYAPWQASGPLDAADRRLVTRILETVGSADEVADERSIDVLSAISGTGHAYPALLAGALLAAARTQGLPEAIAVRAVEAMVCDAAQLLRGGIADTDAVLEQFMGYAGVTAAGLTAAREAGFDEAVGRAIDAGVRRAATRDW